ncbi:MAG: V-type ATPase subunit [Erysipelotrichaceae bacterium]|jgi:V/A-type H+-transporting ATPase subunit C|nr:V-type ATPase subunit [Erysipelotrichaceae bacterium]
MELAYSANAMSAKIMAMFGKRLRDSDYESLLNKKSIGEVASYLKSQTYFSSALKDINESAIHRGQLESLIRQDLYARFSRLIRYGGRSEARREFYHYGLMEVEVSQILSCVNLIRNQDSTAMIAKLPLFLKHHASFDLANLANVNDFAGLLKVLQGTDYYQPALPYLSQSPEDIDVPGLESSLRSVFCQKVLDMIIKKRKGKDTKALIKVFSTQIELENIVKIYRAKKYFHLSGERIEEVLTPVWCNFSPKQVHQMVYDMDETQFLDALSHSVYRRYIDPNNFLYIEVHTKKISYDLNTHNLIYGQDPDLVLQSYLSLAESEIENIVDIVEGIRYHVPQDVIERLLVR